MGKNNEEYAKLIKAMKIEEIYLKAMDVCRTLDLNYEKRNLNLNVEEVTYTYDEEKGNIKYEININVMGYYDEEKKENNENLHINITYIVIYSLKNHIETTDELLERYEKNAIFNVWPYIRSTVNDISDKMKLSLPPVPLFKL